MEKIHRFEVTDANWDEILKKFRNLRIGTRIHISGEQWTILQDAVAPEIETGFPVRVREEEETTSEQAAVFRQEAVAFVPPQRNPLKYHMDLSQGFTSPDHFLKTVKDSEPDSLTVTDITYDGKVIEVAVGEDIPSQEELDYVTRCEPVIQRLYAFYNECPLGTPNTAQDSLFAKKLIFDMILCLKQRCAVYEVGDEDMQLYFLNKEQQTALREHYFLPSGSGKADTSPEGIAERMGYFCQNEQGEHIALCRENIRRFIHSLASKNGFSKSYVTPLKVQTGISEDMALYRLTNRMEKILFVRLLGKRIFEGGHPEQNGPFTGADLLTAADKETLATWFAELILDKFDRKLYRFSLSYQKEKFRSVINIPSLAYLSDGELESYKARILPLLKKVR